MGYRYKVVIADVEYGMSDISSCKIEHPLFDKLSVGNTCAAELDIAFWPKGNIPKMAKIVPYIIDEDGTETSARGTVEGRIGYAEQGDGGFGYDPLFWPDVFDGTCTLAEVPQARKNEVSHRGNALRALRFKLEIAQAKREEL